MFSADSDGGNFEIIIYILFAIVGLIANAYRNYSKRKTEERRSEPGDDNPFPDIFFDTEEEQERRIEPEEVYSEEKPNIEVIEDDTIIESFPQPEPDIVTRVGQEKLVMMPEKETPESTELLQDKTISDEVSDIINRDHSGIKADSIFDSDEIGDYKEEVKQELEFDLEQAVIFSEILSPKYFKNSY